MSKGLLTPALLFFLSISLVLNRADSQCATEEATASKLTSAEALQKLVEGNARFVAETQQHPHNSGAWRSSLESGQHPFAVVLGCSDSRVSPELIFDQGLGDLFVVRVAGNVVDTDVTASIEYAVDHCESPLVVVLGHSCCGAITATFDHFHDTGSEPAEVIELMNRLEPAVLNLPKDASRADKITVAVQRNVELAVRRLKRVPDLAKSVKSGRIQIVGAIYDLHSGKVEFLPEQEIPERTTATDASPSR